jgi:hypothetical protein
MYEAQNYRSFDIENNDSYNKKRRLKKILGICCIIFIIISVLLVYIKLCGFSSSCNP